MSRGARERRETRLGTRVQVRIQRSVRRWCSDTQPRHDGAVLVTSPSSSFLDDRRGCPRGRRRRPDRRELRRRGERRVVLYRPSLRASASRVFRGGALRGEHRGRRARLVRCGVDWTSKTRREFGSGDGAERVEPGVHDLGVESSGGGLRHSERRVLGRRHTRHRRPARGWHGRRAVPRVSDELSIRLRRAGIRVFRRCGHYGVHGAGARAGAGLPSARRTSPASPKPR